MEGEGGVVEQVWFDTPQSLQAKYQVKCSTSSFSLFEIYGKRRIVIYDTIAMTDENMLY